MYILVNSNNIIVGSAKNMPSESTCSKKGQKVYEIPDSEYDPSMINSSLKSFEIIDLVKDGG